MHPIVLVFYSVLASSYFDFSFSVSISELKLTISVVITKISLPTSCCYCSLVFLTLFGCKDVCHLHTGGVMRSARFVSFCLYVQDYCKSNQPMSLKLDVMIGPTNRKNF